MTLDLDVPGTVVLAGIARDAKGGAVLVLDDGTVAYIEGMGNWPPSLDGSKVRVAGRLVRKKLIPDPVMPGTGEIAQGAWGEQLVIESATIRK